MGKRVTAFSRPQAELSALAAKLAAEQQERDGQ